MNKRGGDGQGIDGHERDDGDAGARPESLAEERLSAMKYAEADWRSRGACLSVDPELFFPLSSVGPAAKQLNKSKSVCTRCPVQAQCLDFALATRQMDGIWGGTSEDERRRILARIDGRSARHAKVPIAAGRAR